MECCGVNSPDDYIPILNGTDLPKSCCLSLPKDKTCTKTDASKNGCKSALLNYLSSRSTILAGVAVAVGLIQVNAFRETLKLLKMDPDRTNFCIHYSLLQIVGLGYACCLYRAFRKNYEAV